MHTYRPSEGHGLKHNPFASIIAPRPIGWISSKDALGNVNLAPYSFFNAFNYTPPIIGFSSVGYKDTVSNISETGEFCWNFVSQSLAIKMNQTSKAVASECDEFELAGLTKKPSSEISVPHVQESPVVMECKKSQIVQLSSAAGETVESYMVLGEVVCVHIHQDMIKDGVFDLLKADPVLRAGGQGDYFTLSAQHMFEMIRPQS
ncbi:flavin reductase family protein [Aestuariibacter salexigens]|uniref:flavin reductase family protein n=1 Tax=Aestuariibacter salexigens TaxID=226010 RepID=UPI00041ABE1F|nr:flavin reductase family protein [Aestuariibacter salexigens]